MKEASPLVLWVFADRDIEDEAVPAVSSPQVLLILGAEAVLANIPFLLPANALAQGEPDDDFIGRGALEKPLANFPAKPLPNVNEGVFVVGLPAVLPVPSTSSWEVLDAVPSDATVSAVEPIDREAIDVTEEVVCVIVDKQVEEDLPDEGA